jgi:dihydroneopterin aldolase
MAEYTILLDALAIAIRLGIHPHEAEPQRVTVSVEMTVRYPAPVAVDAIDQVLDYDFLREGILSLAATQPFALQETLCDRIAALCFEDARVVAVRVRTIKTDVYPDSRVGCEIRRTR